MQNKYMFSTVDILAHITMRRPSSTLFAIKKNQNWHPRLDRYSLKYSKGLLIISCVHVFTDKSMNLFACIDLDNSFSVLTLKKRCTYISVSV